MGTYNFRYAKYCGHIKIYIVLHLVTASGETVAVYNYDAWGKVVSVLSGAGADVTGDLTHIGNINPIRYRSYYYDVETGLYYLNARYYDPTTSRFISPDILAESGNLYAYCQNDPVNRVDESGYWSWKKFWEGAAMAVTATVAIALSVATFGAGIPVAMAVVAGVTLTAGVLTGINAVATMVEAGTDYNFVRDGVFNEILGLSDDAYNIYAGATETVAAVGSIILGVYHTTGQYKAAKSGQEFLGKGSTKVDTNRWVSKDGMRQMRWDKVGHGGGLPHFNLETWKNPIVPGTHNKIVKNIHQFYQWFRTWIG